MMSYAAQLKRFGVGGGGRHSTAVAFALRNPAVRGSNHSS